MLSLLALQREENKTTDIDGVSMQDTRSEHSFKLNRTTDHGLTLKGNCKRDFKYGVNE